MNNILRVLLIIGIIGSATLLAFTLVATREAPPKRSVPSTALLVDTVRLERVNADFKVRTQGTVAPKTETIVSAEVSGTITQVSPDFVAGGLFEAGDVLLRIDQTDYRAAVEQAQALVRQREIEFEGAKKLRTQGFRAEADFASASAALAAAKAELVRARRNLERTEIRLPYDGLVRRKEADIGQFVTPGTRLGVVFGTKTAEVRLPLTDEDLAFVDIPPPRATRYDGPEALLRAEQAGEIREWDARIVRSEGTVDPASRVTYVVAQVDDPYARSAERAALPVGTFVIAEIDGRSASDILRVPRAALRGSNQLMFRDEESRLRIRTVDVIRADSDFAYLSGGASAGEEVIVTALESPVNGTLVRTPEDPQPVAEAEPSPVTDELK